MNKGNQNTRVVEEKPGVYDHPSDDEGEAVAVGEAPMEAGGEAPAAFDAQPVGSIGRTSSLTTSSPMPDGWEEKSDPSSGRKYYVNHLTKQTQWDRPCVALPPLPPPVAARVVRTIALTVGAFGCRSGGAAAPPPAAAAGGLPAGWEEKTDPSSGKKYYVNHERKVTQWDRPT